MYINIYTYMYKPVLVINEMQWTQPMLWREMLCLTTTHIRWLRNVLFKKCEESISHM